MTFDFVYSIPCVYILYYYTTLQKQVVVSVEKHVVIHNFQLCNAALCLSVCLIRESPQQRDTGGQMRFYFENNVDANPTSVTSRP